MPTAKPDTLADLEAQVAALNVRKAELERQAAADLVPLYGEILDLVTDEDAKRLLARATLLQGRLEASTVAHQQAGHLPTVMLGIANFFQGEKARLEALANGPMATA